MYVENPDMARFMDASNMPVLWTLKISQIISFLNRKEKERRRTKNIKAKLVADIDEETLASCQICYEGGEEERIHVLDGTFNRKFLDQSVIFTKLFLLSRKVSDLKMGIS